MVAASSIVRELQLMFGTNNTLTINGSTEALTITPGREVIKLTVDRKMNTSLEKVMIEVNANKLVKDEHGRNFVVPVLTIK